MTSRQLQYVLLLAEERNFSVVAEKLNITQPALSKQIINLESELGVRLFDRSISPIEITPAGTFFIREAREILYKEEQLIKSMEKFKSGKAGELVIGITPFRSSYFITDVIKQVREVLPDITIKLNEMGSDMLRREVAEGKCDFAVVNLPVDDSILDIRVLEPDELVLAIPKGLECKLPESVLAHKQIEFKDCKNLPFVVVGEMQEMRQLFEKLCALANFKPIIAAEVVSLTTAWSVACSGIGATILPWQFVKQEDRANSLTILSIRDNHYKRCPAIVTRKNQYISDAAAYAIQLLEKGEHMAKS